MNYTKKEYKLLGYVIPAVLIYVIFCLYPLLASVYYSMLDWDGIGIQKFIFFANFAKIMHDGVFWMSVRNSLILAGYGIFIKLPIAFFLAIVMNHRFIKHTRFYRFTFFLPVIISAASIALMWKFIYDPNIGMLNAVLQHLGLGRYVQDWLGSYDTAVFYVFIPSIWQSVGWNFVLYSAGLASISRELYEAAEIDGASFFQQSFHITLPMMRDILVISLILDLTSALKSFDMVYILTKGGPANSTQIMGTYMYKSTFELFKYGYGTAVGMMIFVMSVIFTLAMGILTKKDVKS